MSTINVNNLSGRGGATPNLPDGAVISGVATVTNLKPTNVNVSGAVTATTFDGSLKSTGTPTLGLGVTINASGVAVSGVLTATTFKGDGSNLTGVGVTIAPINYNPDVGGTKSSITTGIGITFNQTVIAGTGNATLRIAGAAGTVVENFGVGSSITIAGGSIKLQPSSNLSVTETYHISFPAALFKNNVGDTNSEAISWTFTTEDPAYRMYSVGFNQHGQMGINSSDASGATRYSSPVQVPGTTWKQVGQNLYTEGGKMAVKTDGTLWAWGYNEQGELGQNNRTSYSSPTQIGSDTTWAAVGGNRGGYHIVKTDGTLWVVGKNGTGSFGTNQSESTLARVSSPVQIPGTTWTGTLGIRGVTGGYEFAGAVKTDGTLWMWGNNGTGYLGLGNNTSYSSPVQVPGTTWRSISSYNTHTMATKTDGTLWAWGENGNGMLGQNNTTQYSSPKQIPGTNWSSTITTGMYHSGALKTDGTLWLWGGNHQGQAGQNNETPGYSSPIQVPGSYDYVEIGGDTGVAYGIKTDGTLWSWGDNEEGTLAINVAGGPGDRSSPVQIGSGTDWSSAMASGKTSFFIESDFTP